MKMVKFGWIRDFAARYNLEYLPERFLAQSHLPVSTVLSCFIISTSTVARTDLSFCLYTISKTMEHRYKSHFHIKPLFEDQEKGQRGLKSHFGPVVKRLKIKRQ